jgi:hypothetical protein
MEKRRVQGDKRPRSAVCSVMSLIADIVHLR